MNSLIKSLNAEMQKVVHFKKNSKANFFEFRNLYGLNI